MSLFKNQNKLLYDPISPLSTNISESLNDFHEIYSLPFLNNNIFTQDEFFKKSYEIKKIENEFLNNYESLTKKYKEKLKKLSDP